MLRPRGDDGLPPLLDDLAHRGDARAALAEVGHARGQLRARGLEARHGAGVARDEVAEHRHRLDGVALVVDRQQHADVAQPAEAVERAEALGEELLLPLDARRERGDLPFDGLLLLLEPRLHVDGERELARADAELEVRFLELLLRALLLRAHGVEALAKAGDVGADPFEVGVARGLGGEGEKDDDRDEAAPKTRALHASPPAAAPLSSTTPRRAARGSPPSPRR